MGCGSQSVETRRDCGDMDCFQTTRYVAALLSPLIHAHPDRLGSFNNNTELQSIFDEFLDALTPYSTAGTHLTQSGYVDLPMPWDDPDTSEFYDQQASTRHVLTAEDGFVPNAGRKESNQGRHNEPVDKQVQRIERLVGTFGSLSRWQKENPKFVGTEKDPARILMSKVRKVLEQSGEPIELTALAAKMAVALILVKRK